MIRPVSPVAPTTRTSGTVSEEVVARGGGRELGSSRSVLRSKVVKGVEERICWVWPVIRRRIGIRLRKSVRGLGLGGGVGGGSEVLFASGLGVSLLLLLLGGGVVVMRWVRVFVRG